MRNATANRRRSARTCRPCPARCAPLLARAPRAGGVIRVLRAARALAACRSLSAAASLLTRPYLTRLRAAALRRAWRWRASSPTRAGWTATGTWRSSRAATARRTGTRSSTPRRALDMLRARPRCAPGRSRTPASRPHPAPGGAPPPPGDCAGGVGAGGRGQGACAARRLARADPPHRTTALTRPATARFPPPAVRHVRHPLVGLGAPLPPAAGGADQRPRRGACTAPPVSCAAGRHPAHARGLALRRR